MNWDFNIKTFIFSKQTYLNAYLETQNWKRWACIWHSIIVSGKISNVFIIMKTPCKIFTTSRTEIYKSLHCALSPWLLSEVSLGTSIFFFGIFGIRYDLLIFLENGVGTAPPFFLKIIPNKRSHTENMYTLSIMCCSNQLFGQFLVLCKRYNEGKKSKHTIHLYYQKKCLKPVNSKINPFLPPKFFSGLLLFGIYFSNWSWINSPQILKMSLVTFISSIFLNFGNFFARFLTEIKGHFKLCRLR